MIIRPKGGPGGGLNALLAGSFPSTQLGFTCQHAHLGAGFPLASHSIRMLSRGSTMWSFTDCLVMVGGWDTATVSTDSQGCRGLGWGTTWTSRPGGGQGPRSRDLAP